jgi:hypothetical protein
MSDRLYLSCWVRGFDEHRAQGGADKPPANGGLRAYNGRNMLRHFEKMLALFPFSKLSPRGPQLHVYATAYSEPILAEHNFLPGTAPADIAAVAREFVHDHEDCAVEVEAEWDLWQLGEMGWHLAPARVILACFGPEFENEDGDHLRIELGLDSLYLPQKGVAGSLRTAQSNLRSLLHLVNEIESALPLERRSLWSESGVNFSALVAETLARLEAN